MKNPGGNIKNMSVALLVLSLLSGVIWLFITFSRISEAWYANENPVNLFVYPVCLILSSIVSFLLMYGFGQLVENSDILVDNLSRRNIDTAYRD